MTLQPPRVRNVYNALKIHLVDTNKFKLFQKLFETPGYIIAPFFGMNFKDFHNNSFIIDKWLSANLCVGCFPAIAYGWLYQDLFHAS